MHVFDATTALDAAGEGSIDRAWWIERGPYGGYVSALLARAALAAAPDRELRTLSVHFVAPPAEGPVRVRAEVVRAGRSATTVSVRMEQESVVLAIALILLGAARETEAGLGWDDAAMPAAPAPQDCDALAGIPLPPFVSQFDVRPVAHGPGVRNLAWLAHTPARDLDPLSLVLFADTWMPAAMSHHGRPLVVPTYDLTVHLRAPVPAGERFVLAEFRSAQAVRGTWVEDGELWSEGGVLLAVSRQLAMLRDSPAR